MEKGNAAYELYKQTYPRDITPYINIGVTASQLGNFEKALSISLEAIRVDPDEERGYGGAASSYAAVNRLEEAKTVANQELRLIEMRKKKEPKKGFFR